MVCGITAKPTKRTITYEALRVNNGYENPVRPECTPSRCLDITPAHPIEHSIDVRSSLSLARAP